MVQRKKTSPPQTTLLDILHQRKQAAPRNASPPALSSRTERILDASLWTFSIAMLHFTFDVLVQNQYAREIDLLSVFVRAIRAWAGMLSSFCH